MLHLRRALAAVAVGVVVVSPLGCGGGSTAGSAGPASTLPGTPGHFDDGALSFDYPTDWAVIAGTDNGAEGVMDVLAVLGTGSWSENCQFAGDSEHSSMNCGADKIAVPTGGIIVKVYLWYGGPAVPCRGDVQADGTFGDLAVRKTANDSVTTWEIRAPGNEFGQPNNIFVEAHTADATQLARAEAVMSSLRWRPTDFVGLCSPAPSVIGPAAS